MGQAKKNEREWTQWWRKHGRPCLDCFRVRTQSLLLSNHINYNNIIGIPDDGQRTSLPRQRSVLETYAVCMGWQQWHTQRYRGIPLVKCKWNPYGDTCIDRIFITVYINSSSENTHPVQHQSIVNVLLRCPCKARGRGETEKTKGTRFFPFIWQHLSTV